MLTKKVEQNVGYFCNFKKPAHNTYYLHKQENSPNLVTLFGPFVKQVFLLLSRSLLDDFNNQYYCTNVNTYIYGF
jgi:hypothetical protein